MPAFLIFLVALVAQILLIVALIVLLGIFFMRLLPRGPRAQPPPQVDCSLPSGRLPDDTDPAVTLTGAEVDFDIRGSTIDLPDGVTLRAARDLTLVAFGDITINGRLTTEQAPINITVVSLNGTVTVGRTGVIGPAGIFGAPPPNGAGGLYAKALGTPGLTAGFVKIRGVNIAIDGLVYGQLGGPAGGASSTGSGLGPFGGLAAAIGAEGGAGGTIFLCALESIAVLPRGGIRAGDGGFGGSAVATAANADLGVALGGPGNAGGDVVFFSTGPDVCQVFFERAGPVVGEARAGNGGAGGNAFAAGGPGRTSMFPLVALLVGSGGRGVARGGNGGNAGTVRFPNCVVSRVNRATAGTAGTGGPANAFGGGGAPGLVLSGYSGGDARSRGGDGGVRGALPTFLLIDGGSAAVAPPIVLGGSGGPATSTPGIGGPGGRFGAGGSSGEARATGGSNPAGGVGTLVVGPPVVGGPAPRGAGGIGGPVTSPGAP